MKLHGFQEADAARILEASCEHRRVLYVLPTGGGKTCVMAALARAIVDEGERILVLAHRRELVDQAVDKFVAWGVDEDDIGVMMAGDTRRDPHAAIQVASVDTYRNRVSDVRADYVFIDEAHRAVAVSYQRILEGNHRRAQVVGFTATPYRLDGTGMVRAFDTIVQGPNYTELIAEGVLVSPRVFTVSDDKLPNLEGLRCFGGDFNTKDLSERTNRKELVGCIVEHWLRVVEGRATVLFAVDIEHSVMLWEEFAQAGVASAHLDANTPLAARARILGDLASGKIKVITNCGILTEGWDAPHVKCAILARPTRSLGLFLQMGGRLFRPFNGVVPLILDHAGNAVRHGLPHEDRRWSIYGTRKKAGMGGMRAKACPMCFEILATAATACTCGAIFWTPPGVSVSEVRQ